jgi:hypothetical protein
MENEDWDQLEDAASPQAAQSPAQAGGADWDSMPDSPTGHDDLTDEEIPAAFSGTSPATAMNRTVVDATDRLKLSMGNEEGNIQYLKKKFQDVQPIPGESGELAVMQDGQWYRVDPKNGDIRDPWELAKSYMKDPYELMSDVADTGPLGVGLAAGAAVPAALVAKAPLAIGAAIGAGSALLRTSLGRVVGTYDATPEQQVKDIAFETILNAAGTKIAVGVKPHASWVADKLDDVAKKFKDVVPQGLKEAGEAVANTPKAMFKKVFSALSVGEDNFDTMVQNPFKVKAYMKAFDKRAGGQTSTYHDMIGHDQLKRIRTFAEKSRETLSTIYGAMRNKILADVPDTFTSNTDDVLKQSYSDAISKGLAKIKVGDKWMEGAEAAEHIAKNGIASARFALKSQRELKEAIQASGEMGEQLGFLAQDAEAYGLVKQFYDRIGTFAGTKGLQGKAGAKQLLDLKKNLSDIAWSLENSEKAQAIPAVKSLFATSRVGMDNAINDGLNKAGKGAAFRQMNSTYAKLNEEFKPVLNALNRFQKTNDMSVFQQLQSAFVARPGKQAAKKFAIDAAIDAADAYGHKGLSTSLANDKLMLQVGEAAKAFNPLPRSGLQGTQAQAGMGLFAATQIAQQPALAAAIGIPIALSKPATAKLGAAMFRGLPILQQNAKDFLSSPQAIAAYTSAVLQAPQLRSEVENGLLGQIK